VEGGSMDQLSNFLIHSSNFCIVRHKLRKEKGRGEGGEGGEGGRIRMLTKVIELSTGTELFHEHSPPDTSAANGGDEGCDNRTRSSGER
jgi:hypothetical protein